MYLQLVSAKVKSLVTQKIPEHRKCPRFKVQIHLLLLEELPTPNLEDLKGLGSLHADVEIHPHGM